MYIHSLKGVRKPYDYENSGYWDYIGCCRMYHFRVVKNESTKYKIFYFIWVILGVVLDLSNGLIIIVGLILLGVLLIIYSPLFN